MYIDLLNRIKNAQKRGKINIKVPYSKFDESICDILKKNNFINDFSKIGKSIMYLDIYLSYKDEKNNIPSIKDIKFISKPSRRMYISYKDLKPVRQKYGIAVLSTSSGIMTDKDAKKNKIGGELLFEIW